jgi:hypothetical protein
LRVNLLLALYSLLNCGLGLFAHSNSIGYDVLQTTLLNLVLLFTLLPLAKVD